MKTEQLKKITEELDSKIQNFQEDKEDRTPVTQTPLPLWSFVWSGLRVLSTGDVTSYSISYSRGNIP